LFVPFADTRHRDLRERPYLDLAIEPEGSVVLDFNLTYHRYYAYSRAYSCP